jgi:hypothetical protein
MHRLAMVVWIALPSETRADDQVLPCRPTITCTAELAAPGTLEVELGYQLRRADGAFADATPVLIKLPVSHELEIQLGTNGYIHTDEASYVDDVVAGVKFHAIDQTEQRPAFAVTASLSIPTVAQRGYVQNYDLALTGHASKDVGSLHLDFNIGLMIDQLEGPRAEQPWIALAATYAVTKTFAVALEPHYFADAAPLAPRDAGVIAAVELAARGWLVVDAAVDAIGWDQRSLTAIVGLSIAPVRLWGHS